ncbi:MAG: SAM-dependent methyltransferase [Nitrospirales bacterium]|nr:MAG: SAM-dependent methyltransferase [Nitrospirales bacterium]
MTSPSRPISRDSVRFQFGKNWKRFIELLDESRIVEAQKSLHAMLEIQDFRGKRFLDIGSGSGLFSLAARMLGASVCSFDFDAEAVACTKSIRDQFFPHDSEWKIQQGDVLDQKYLMSLDTYDIIYSWGVLHHTGSMWKALENITTVVGNKGYVFIAIYNDQGFISRYWLQVKKVYNANWWGQVVMILIHAPYLYILRRLVRLIQGRGKLPRGMDLWRDMVDWLGGYPFEVAKPEEVVQVFTCRGFRLVKLKTCGRRHGCNEFIFRRVSQ